MRTWTSLLFLALFIAGLFYLLRVELPESEKREKLEFVFHALPKESFRSIAISKGGQRFTLRRDTQAAESGEAAEKAAAPERWNFNTISGADADVSALNALLGALKDIKYGEAIPKADMESNLEVYGLANPAITLEVEYEGQDKKDARLFLELGKKNAYLNQRYLRVYSDPAAKEGPVYLIPETLHAAADKDPADFRNKNPISFADADILKSEFDRAGSVIEIERVKEAQEPGDPRTFSRWRMLKPISDRVSDSAFMDMIRALRSLKVTEFIDGEAAADKSKFGLDAPEARIRITFSEESKRQPLEVLIKSSDQVKQNPLNKKSGVFFSLGSNPSVYYAEPAMPSALAKEPDALRETQLLRFNYDQAASFSYTREDGETISASRERQKPPPTPGSEGFSLPWNDWLVDGASGDQVFIRQLLVDMSNIKAAAFPNNSAITADQAKRRFTLNFEDGKKLTLLIMSETEYHKSEPVSSEAAASGKSSGKNSAAAKEKGFLAAVLAGDDDKPRDVMVLSKADVEKLFPRKEVILPAKEAASG